MEITDNKKKASKVLKTKSKNWTYLTEGNAHIIFKYKKENGPFCGKLLVLEKKFINNEAAFECDEFKGINDMFEKQWNKYFFKRPNVRHIFNEKKRCPYF